MSFPADIPNPDQENVFYSIPAFKIELLNYFSKEAVEGILEILQNFYLPVIVFDDAAAPNSFTIDVYPQDRPKQNYILDSDGKIISSVEPKKATVSPPLEDSLFDNALPCKLNSSFYSQSKLKSPLEIELGTIEDVLPVIDLVVSTKFWKDEQLLKERSQNFSILKNLLLAKLKTLPDNELTAIKENYEVFVKNIGEFRNILQEIKEGQQSSVDGLYYSNYYKNVYDDTRSLKDLERKGLDGTKMIIAQALSDFSNPTRINNWINKGSWRNNSKSVNWDEVQRVTDGWYAKSTDIPNIYIWPSFVDKLVNLGKLQLPETTIPANGLITSFDNTDLNAIFTIGSKEVFSVDGKPREWYYDNFEKIVTGKDTNFSEMENYIAGFKSIIERYNLKSNLYSKGGLHLLVDQAIKKAIVKLCLSNLEVTDFAPTTGDGTNFFSKIIRSGTLGPSGTTPYPSKYVLGEEDFKPNPYTNTSFLCYHGLIQIIRKVSTNSNSRNFLEENLVNFNSDHDSVIDLLEVLHDGGLDTSLSQAGTGTGSAARYRTVRQCVHAYKKNEVFDPSFPWVNSARDVVPSSDYRKIILLATGDGVPPAERSFTQWYLRRLGHVDESVEDQSDYWPLSKDYSSSVNDSGFLEDSDIPQAYQDMGFAKLTTQYGVPLNPEHKRTKNVHYGFGSNRSTNILEFYKQKRYSMPYFWTCMVSLWRAITVETWKEMINSVNDIMGTSIEMSAEEILETFDHTALWSQIRSLINVLNEERDIKISIYVSIDGTLNFVEQNAIGGQVANSFEYRNTPGLNSKKLMQSWVKFVSTISNHSSVQIVDDYNLIDFDESLYLPPEGIARNTNPNFSNNHGGSSQYIQPVWSKYNDKLEYKIQEFKLGLPIGKSTSALGMPIVGENTVAQSYIDTTKILHKHSNMFEHLISSIEGIKDFIVGFQVPESISNIFNSGYIDTRKELQDPDGLIRQIDENQIRYQADEFGLGKRWGWSVDIQDFMKTSSDWLYVQVLGVKKDAFTRFGKRTFTGGKVATYIDVCPEYVGVDSSIQVVGATHRIHLELTPNHPDWKKSQMILQYLHLLRGIDLYDATFSEHNTTVYSDLLIDSESGIFPWTSDDFEGGIPKKQLETIYNMSPWLFPENYFYDVCIQNQYHRVFGCAISKTSLLEAGVGVEIIEGNIEDIIGSIRWVIRR